MIDVGLYPCLDIACSVFVVMVCLVFFQVEPEGCFSIKWSQKGEVEDADSGSACLYNKNFEELAYL